MHLTVFHCALYIVTLYMKQVESVHLYIVRCSVETFGVVLGTHVSVLISGGYGGQAGGAGRLFR